MAILIFVLSLILLIAGAASGYQSVDLLPTSVGVLYALAAAAAVCAAVVTFAIAVAIRRIDTLTKLVGQSDGPSLFRPGLGDDAFARNRACRRDSQPRLRPSKRPR